MEGIALLRRAAEELREGRKVVECVVLASRGSAARHAGARMLTLQDGTLLGTVGGGTPELRCQQMCREALADGRPRRTTMERGVVDIACGGAQDLGIRAMSQADLVALDAALAAADAGEPGCLAVDWSAPEPVASFVPAGIGQDMDAGQGIGAGEPPAGPRMEGDVYVEPIVAAERVVIFGGGHVGRACVPALAAIDFEVTVFDDRPDVALPENFPDAAHVILGSFKDIAAGITLGARDYVIVMTHGHVADEDVVAQAIGAHPRYLGCMGSRHKRRALERVVAERGASPAEIAAVDLPIGLSLGAVTPAEIAVSIAAKLIEVRHAHDGDASHACPSH